MLPRTVKEIPGPDRKSKLTDAFLQQIYRDASGERTCGADCQRLLRAGRSENRRRDHSNH
jgi:hypothetical protein